MIRYFGIALVHLLCYGLYVWLVKMKASMLSKMLPQAFIVQRVVFVYNLLRRKITQLDDAKGVIPGISRQNLAMITAKKTKDVELVLIHLGDCLWKETSNTRVIGHLGNLHVSTVYGGEESLQLTWPKIVSKHKCLSFVDSLLICILIL
uniref:Uncharacterized protein n=1 Tax=Lactuca sativa TaxID=4236 RepID=A0A9R1W9S0_LACSA|nr:hypothetical protein LSAT_V11C300129250 [Lactuca sativa]